MILPDHEIRSRFVNEPRRSSDVALHDLKTGRVRRVPLLKGDPRRIFEPWYERTKHRGMSFGLSMGGYDVRCDERIVLGAGTGWRAVWNAVTRRGKPSFSLASTVEHFTMPADLMGIVHDKSTWAREGLAVQNTVIEPGWHGHLTLELSNQSARDIVIEAGDPIAQIVLHKLASRPQAAYEGKYQGQRAGAVPAVYEQA